MAENYRYSSVDDFFAAIGYGAIGAQTIVSKMGVADDANQQVLPAVAPPVLPTRTGGVRVRGLGGLMTRFAGCCSPITGDPIVGYVTRGRGVTVHLPTCPTVVNEKDVGRMIDVEWEGQVAQTYPISIRVEAYDRTGLLSEITNVVAENKVNIIAANVRVHDDHTATVQATLEVSSVAQLAKVLSRIEQLRDVYSVARDLS
jgi:guanosine-3',5'-bis(diphosphate) 3'-pyrophosphohydrolase